MVGAERIDADTLEQVVARPVLTREALIPAYGLAEAVMAVTMTEVRASRESRR